VVLVLLLIADVLIFGELGRMLLYHRQHKDVHFWIYVAVLSLLWVGLMGLTLRLAERLRAGAAGTS
jgi:hypothetical protein